MHLVETRNVPVIAIYGGHTGNDEEQNIISLENGIRAGKVSLTSHLFNVRAEIAVISQTIFSPYHPLGVLPTWHLIGPSRVVRESLCTDVFTT